MAQLVKRRVKREEGVGGSSTSVPQHGRDGGEEPKTKHSGSSTEWSLFVIMILETIMSFVGQLLDTLRRGTVKEDLLVEAEK